MIEENLEFEKATKEDVKVILQMYNDLIDSYEGKTNYPDWTKNVYPSYEYLFNAYQNGELFKGTLDDEIVAALVINTKANDDYKNVPWTIPEPEESILIMHSFLINKDYQRKGLGKKMIEKIIEYARDKNFKSIHLDTIYQNRPAVSFYKNSGFSCLGQFELNYDDTDETRFYLFEYNL